MNQQVPAIPHTRPPNPIEAGNDPTQRRPVAGIVNRMTPQAPKVTVGMAVYRGEKYIAEAITSVLSETFVDWELLLVDDGSPDTSIEVISTFNDPRIRLLVNETNQGLVTVRNRIMAEARGTYVAWLDQDDLTFPTRLATQVAYLDTHPDIALCGSWTQMRHESLDGSVSVTTERLPQSYEQIRASMMFLNPIACNTVMMRHGAFIERGLQFRPAFGNTLDYDLWSNASDNLRVCNLPIALAAYRVHASQTSQGVALDQMNDHALQVQIDLIDRTLAITLSDDDRHFHRAATISPVIIADISQLEAIASWFSTLKAANEATGAFDSKEFSQALCRQWTTVVLASARSPIPKQDLLRQAIKGARRIGLPVSALARSSSAGLRRRAARR